eukprot:5525196-Pleurochrysis_carterae.AAC.1
MITYVSRAHYPYPNTAYPVAERRKRYVGPLATRCGEGTGEGADTVARKADDAALSPAYIS